MTTTINTHLLLFQYFPTISPFGIDGNTCIQRSDFNSPLHSTIQTLLCIRPISLESVTEIFRTRLLSPPLTSMSKKTLSSTDLVAEHTPPVIYNHLGNFQIFNKHSPDLVTLFKHQKLSPPIFDEDIQKGLLLVV
jgi:hypothetical protein